MVRSQGKSEGSTGPPSSACATAAKAEPRLAACKASALQTLRQLTPMGTAASMGWGASFETEGSPL